MRGERMAPRRRSRNLIAVSVVTTAALMSGAVVTASGHVQHAVRALGPHGIGNVRFGVTEADAVTALRAKFGAPTAEGINTGCGSRFTEVEWGDLAVEFRSHRFSGYRYVSGGFELTTHYRPRKTVSPKVTTSTGISLGSTVRQLHAAYPALSLAGAESWRARNGLTFVAYTRASPPPLSSRIGEIKIDACGDY